MEQILDQYPSTAQLALASLAVSVCLGVTWGVLAAIRRNSWLDTSVMVIAMLWVSMPSFWLGLLFIYIFSVKLGWFPPAGSTSLRHLVLPAFALGMRSSGLLARLTRSSMLEVLRQDYVTTARAKGLSERVVIWRHALKNALIPVITMIGIDFGHLLGGAVIAEIVFARRGIGDMIIKAIIAHDFPLVQGGVFILACAFVMVNSLVDVTYGFLDPRIRYD